MNKLMLTLKLLVVVTLVATPIANAKIQAGKIESNQTVYTYYGSAIGHGEDQPEAAADAHDQVWDIVNSIGVITGYTLIDLRIISEGPFDPNTGTYPVTFEADFWDGGNFKRSPVPLNLLLGGM